eukprot:CAMPEP_0113478958 /NCGR_PEP_ID=MMETSP0014_2-20120614/21043_1 /TAXON_ID=2857 /ORGANISM="Nitzschia sp." /LENGTH=729 /DNA_ID=CAMNT_0000372203 /DNA_START=34 /DNA_END=2220 /DNA_ORIENTATION=- /assembly_acc=CAM_ASM_000159
MSGAWAKGASKAVASAPPAGSFQTVNNNNNRGGSGGGGGRGGGNNNNNNSNNRRRSNHQNNRDDNDGSGRGGGRGGGGRGGRGGGRGGGRNSNNNNNRGGNSQGGGRGRGSNSNNNNGKNNNNNNSNNNNNYERAERIIVKDPQLIEPGSGDTKAQKAVKRITAKDFILMRMQYLDAPEGFSPHDECHWTDENRVDEIASLCSKVMELGDVSKRDGKKPPAHDTAPPLEECKPLEVNEETRWKSKAMTGTPDGEDAGNSKKEETEDEIVSRALLILNKISWTTLDKLTSRFVDETKLIENESIRHKCIDMLIKKAQTEHHFGPMYAQLCCIIIKQFKQFKKDLMAQCQKEFEIDTAHKIANATEGITDPEEIDYHSTLIRKAYVGHIKFLGELYLRDVVKLNIMMYCFDELLKDESRDDESLECFANLMTTIGGKLDEHAKQNGKPFDWNQVVELRHSSEVSSRIKFLLIDLLELRERGWVKRRKEETAKRIDEIHKEVAKEEAAAAANSKMNRRASSSQNLRRSSSMASAPVVDEDGFVSIPSRGSMNRSGSRPNMVAPPPSIPGKPNQKAMRRSQSQPVGMYVDGTGSPVKQKSISTASNLPTVPSSMPTMHEVKYKSPEECADKAKSILKEYFVGGDTADAVLSFDELVCAGKEGSIERGAKVLESGALLVMEMKETDVKKFLTVLESCIESSKIEKESLIKGLNDPLEFLGDIEIDAPLAGNHLA